MTNLEFVKKIKNVLNFKTLYVYGAFGFPLNERNKKRLEDQYAYNRTPSRKKKIENSNSDVFGFDCVNLIKAILWGWYGDKTKSYGGAVYNSNGVSDTNANGLFNKCKYVSRDFNNIIDGAVVWMDGHIGVYIGDGQVVECSPRWQDGVQLTYLQGKGEPCRKWVKWGMLPYIDYLKEDEKPVTPSETIKCSYNKGDMIIIKNRNAYSSAYSKEPFGKKTGTYYIYDGKAFNKHFYRVTCKREWCGKLPTSKYTSFYIKRS